MNCIGKPGGMNLLLQLVRIVTLEGIRTDDDEQRIGRLPTHLLKCLDQHVVPLATDQVPDTDHQWPMGIHPELRSGLSAIARTEDVALDGVVDHR